MKKGATYLLAILLISNLQFGCQSVKRNNQSTQTRPPVPLQTGYVFTDHMVLQQQAEVAFWGNYTTGEKVSVAGSWGASATTRPNIQGEWELTLATPQAGGPYEVVVSTQDSSITFQDVMIGEVWLSSGQSNMEWKLRQCKGCILNQEEEIANANYKDIRMFTVPMDLSGEKIKEAKWLVTTPENAGNSNPHFGSTGFSATAYFFARRLHKDLGVPIGIVNTAWGGTRVEAWTSTNKLNSLIPEKLEDLFTRYDFFDQPEKLKAYNDSIKQVNEILFGFNSVTMPDWSDAEEVWEQLDLQDAAFSQVDYDDSSWDPWEPKLLGESPGNFEAYFPGEDKLLSDGIIWFRTKIEVDDISSDYELIFHEGIDDGDQSYFNGQLVGNTISWNKTRRYKVPKALLKKGENLIAVRSIDFGGNGGWRGPIEFKNASSSQAIPFNAFKFKHHAFIVGNQFLLHNMPTQTLKEKSLSLMKDIKRGISPNDANAYGVLFARMLKPVMPYTIKGAIWYQGESNVDNYQDYTMLFNGMIEDWRSHWGYEFPFYFVQIAPFQYTPSSTSQGLRDAQRKTLYTTPKTGMAILMDIGEKEDIHPKNKQDVGDRLALLALDKDYGQDIVSSGPLYKSHEVFPTYVEVDFEKKGSGLMTKSTLAGFELAGEDGVFYPAIASIVNNKVRVSSPEVSKPAAVRYAWENWTVGTLFNREGLPASSFSSGDE